ncbi:hypothetical protein [Kytococcus sedentarius]|uniref:hypothetical protein n=1 Tax=Kytococcus sedentarius TaxID=1276 RepID=UPI0035BBF586
MALLSLLPLTVSCGSETPLDAAPSSLKEARGLAKSVAESGECSHLEDLDQGEAEWVFTCQNGEGGKNMFVITVTSGPAGNPLGRPVVAGDHYVVTGGDAELLRDFGGQYLS